MTDFNHLSKSKVNEFIQSIICIDDQAYETTKTSGRPNPDERHLFDAKSISEAFSKDGKICAVYKPNSEEDISDLTKIAKKADVAIIDWQIYLDNNPEDPVEGKGDAEEDSDVDDYRGLYTKQIIANLISAPEQQDSIKLIVVYTGDTNIEGIAKEILTDLQSKSLTNFTIHEADNCTLHSDNTKIVVIAKSSGGERGRHHAVLRDKIVSYEDLPEFITNQFTEMTSGLLANFALESLTEIRNSFHQILSLFSNDLDAAYLTHQSIIPDANDANELLIDLMGDTFVSIMRYKKLNRSIDSHSIKLWLEERVEEKAITLQKKDGSLDKHEFDRTHELLLKLLEFNLDTEQKFMDAIGMTRQVDNGNNTSQFSKVKARQLIKKQVTSLFTDKIDPSDINYRFANLCHHRQAFIDPEYEPSLSLGTVVKSSIGDGNYYVCIQQRCDSSRLKDQEKRRFLFISLSEIENNDCFDFLTPDGVKLKINPQTYDLRTVKFIGDDGVVIAKNEGHNTGKIFFKPFNHSYLAPEKFEFIVELKSLYAQQIADNFSSSLSRVGLDEAEWLRVLK